MQKIKNLYPRGSKFRKWDLHIHGPKTDISNKFGKCSSNDFVKKIVDSGIKVVGFTNYFRFSENELEEIKSKLNQKGVTVFYNLEFRTQPKNKENEEMHIHIIFSEQININIINKVLGRIKTIGGKYCNDLTQKEIKEASITFDMLKKYLDEDEDIKYLKDYILVACPRGQGNFRPFDKNDGRGNALAINIDKKTDILFGNQNDVEFFLNKNKERYKKSKPKPVVFCSDAHQLSKIGSKFTWIKSDPTFEGLKQTLWEPKIRVAIQDRNPEESKQKRVIIDYIVYKLSSGEQQKIYFSRDLNSIIGIRGSGKSTLLKNIAFKIDPLQFNKVDLKQPYPLNEFKVIWADGIENSGNYQSQKNIFYIPQKYLSSLAYDEENKAKERDKFLTQLLKKNKRFANAMQLFENLISNNKVKIEELIQKLLASKIKIQETQELLKKQGTKAEIENETKNKQEEIKKYKSVNDIKITEFQLNEYSLLKNKISNYKESVDILIQDRIILVKLEKTGTKIYIPDQEFNLLSLERQELIRSELAKQSNKDLQELIKTQVTQINKQVTQLQIEVEKDSKKFQILEEIVKRSKTLNDLTKEFGDLQKTIETINGLQGNLKKAGIDFNEAVDKLVSLYEDLKNQQKNIFDTVKFENQFSFLNIEIIATYNINGIKDFVEKFINTRDTTPKLKRDKDIESLFSDSPIQPTREAIKKFIINIVSENLKIKKEATDINTVLSQLLKNRYEVDYLQSVRIKDGDVCFKDMTGGQKAIALLELIFSFDDEKYPILIDQPEDDLDVNGVATDLVKFIRSKKQDRQIIVVSHNASLVVCSDSEEIIVSNSKKVGLAKYDFFYNTGAIENPIIRDEIIKILEGGKKALRMRTQKLNFKYEI